MSKLQNKRVDVSPMSYNYNPRDNQSLGEMRRTARANDTYCRQTQRKVGASSTRYAKKAKGLDRGFEMTESVKLDGKVIQTTTKIKSVMYVKGMRGRDLIAKRKAEMTA